MNGVDKYVREAMPIQEEERASGKPTAKARPIFKPSSTSNWNFIPMEQRQWIDIEVKRSKDPYCFQMPKFVAQLLRNKGVGREEDAGVPYDRIVEKCKDVPSEDSRYWSDEMKEKISIAPYWSAEMWIDVLSKGGGQKKRFQYCLKPKCPEKLLFLRAIQDHSGKAHSGNARINPALQDNVLLPKDFTKYVYHVGNGKELRSIVRNGLVPGGFSTETGRHAIFFTVVNPMDDEQGLRETFCDLSKARIVPYKNTLKPPQDTVYWCNLLLAQEGGLQFYQTRSNAVVLYDTLPAEFTEKAICMKTKEQLYQRESARPRVVLRANSQCGLQDLPRQEARSSWKTQSDAQSFQETGCNIKDYRVPGIPLSTVQQQDEQRLHTVAKLIEKFESHQHKEQFFKDISQTQKINRFCEASQKLLQDMDQTQPDTDFRISREFYQTSMLRLQFIYRNRDYSLQLREKFEVQAESCNI